MYVRWGYDINACSIGAERPLIILNSGLVDLCSDGEILLIAFCPMLNQRHWMILLKNEESKF